MRRPISGKSVKISGTMHGHTVSEEMDPKAGGKVRQLEEVQTLIMRTLTHIPSVLIIYSHPHRTAANDSKKPREESVNRPVKRASCVRAAAVHSINSSRVMWLLLH